MFIRWHHRRVVDALSYRVLAPSKIHKRWYCKKERRTCLYLQDKLARRCQDNRERPRAYQHHSTTAPQHHSTICRHQTRVNGFDPCKACMQYIPGCGTTVVCGCATYTRRSHVEPNSLDSRCMASPHFWRVPPVMPTTNGTRNATMHHTPHTQLLLL